MATIRLGIHRDYVPSWGVWEGVRDLVQNALDEDDKGNPLKVVYNRRTKMLRLHNEGAILPKEALAVGFSTKAGDAGQRGQYGEGLKLSMLALLRAGKTVRVYAGNRSYSPEFVYDESLGCEVLAIKTRRNKYFERTEVVIENLEHEEWADCSSRFARWADADPDYSNDGQSIYMDPSMKGMVFVKGIYVCTRDDLEYGYDLRDCKLDRDRRAPDQYSLEWEIGSILRRAVVKGVVPMGVAVDLAESGKVDGRYVMNKYDWEFQKVAVAWAKEQAADADAIAYDSEDGMDDAKIKRFPGKMRDLIEGELKHVSVLRSERRLVPEKVIPDEDLSETAMLGLSIVRAAFDADGNGWDINAAVLYGDADAVKGGLADGVAFLSESLLSGDASKLLMLTGQTLGLNTLEIVKAALEFNIPEFTRSVTSAREVKDDVLSFIR